MSDKTDKWHALLHLTYDCPAIVNGEKITSTPRHLLQVLAFHCDGYTNSTFVGLDRLMKEIGCSHNTLDKAIATIKRAKLLSDNQTVFNAKTQSGGLMIRTLNRAMLEQEVTRAAPEWDALKARKRQKAIKIKCQKLLKALEQEERISYGPAVTSEAEEMVDALNHFSVGPLAFEFKDARPDKAGRERVLLKISKVETHGTLSGDAG